MNNHTFSIQLTDVWKNIEAEGLYYFNRRPEKVVFYEVPKSDTLEQGIFQIMQIVFPPTVISREPSEDVFIQEYEHINFRSKIKSKKAKSYVPSLDTMRVSFGNSSHSNIVYVDKKRKFYLHWGISAGELESLCVCSYNETPDVLLETINAAIQHYCEGILSKTKKRHKIHMLVSDNNGVRLREFFANDEKVPSQKKTHYNDDFVEFSNYVERVLDEDDRQGLVILHGAPGTGKTSYLRYLMGKIQNKKLIYIPPSMSIALSKPDLINVLLLHKNSVIIIEDAELVMMSRDSDNGNNQAVSNLLNISDGLLGDILKFQIVCTFNTDIRNIDEALLRPGRLIGRHEFTALKYEKAIALMKELYDWDTIKDKVIEKDYTLAEIYSLSVPKFNKKKKKFGMGFVPVEDDDDDEDTYVIDEDEL